MGTAAVPVYSAEQHGSWIAKDYPSYEDIGVETEWAGWAQKVITENSAL